jgi:hypothetical protein
MDHRAVEVAFPTGFRHHEISHAWYRNSQDHLSILDDLASIYVFCFREGAAVTVGIAARGRTSDARAARPNDQHQGHDDTVANLPVLHRPPVTACEIWGESFMR